MSSQNALQVYLEDHMAGSVAASDLARRGAAGNQGPLATFYAGLSREIEADRRTLDQIAASVGTQPSALKQAAAVAAERLPVTEDAARAFGADAVLIEHGMTSIPAVLNDPDEIDAARSVSRWRIWDT